MRFEVNCAKLHHRVISDGLSLVGQVKMINVFLVSTICFNETVHNKICCEQFH